MKIIEEESTLETENRRLRRELEDRDRIIQALLAARDQEQALVTKSEYLAPARRIFRGGGEGALDIRLISTNPGWEGLGQLPEYAR